ncbi:protein kinase, putative, partial [Trypanosoma cruzi marinkellei]
MRPAGSDASSRSPAPLHGDDDGHASRPGRHVDQSQEVGSGASEGASYKQRPSRVAETMHAARARGHKYGIRDSRGSDVVFLPTCESRTRQGPPVKADTKKESAHASVSELQKTEDVATREGVSARSRRVASSSAVVYQNENPFLEADKVFRLSDDAGKDGRNSGISRPSGKASSAGCERCSALDSVGAEGEVSALPKITKLNAKSQEMSEIRMAPASFPGEVFPPTESAHRRIQHSSPWRNTFTLSLRCWVLCPLVVILLVVAAVTMALSFATSKSSSESVLLSLHDVVLDSIEESVGDLTLTKMARMAVSTGSMYFSKNTFPNPRADILMPLEGGMMSRLCAVLRDMDPEHQVATIGAVSLTRQQAAVCFNSRSRPGNFVGTVSRNGVIKGFYYVDPVTLEYKIPLEPLGTIDPPISID